MQAVASIMWGTSLYGAPTIEHAGNFAGLPLYRHMLRSSRASKYQSASTRYAWGRPPLTLHINNSKCSFVLAHIHVASHTSLTYLAHLTIISQSYIVFSHSALTFHTGIMLITATTVIYILIVENLMLIVCSVVNHYLWWIDHRVADPADYSSPTPPPSPPASFDAPYHTSPPRRHMRRSRPQAV